MRSLKEWLKNKREESGYTQESLSIKLGIAKTTYASYEQGHRNPSVYSAKKIAKELGFDWTIFFEDEVHNSYAKED
ncbi:helix-turn-helix transcriptional regulator [Carnobacterium divergens]|uniref:helix-turn-helix transcriptional regulator n=1 Tax=Carnobacterium divergens TaxID=2748 RepID=UPI0039AF3456